MSIRVARCAPVFVLLAPAVSIAAGILPADVSFIEGLEMVPQTDIQLIHDDNIYGDKTTATASFISVLSPQFRLASRNKKNEHSATYVLKQGNYSASSADNFTDHQFKLLSHIEADIRNQYNLNYSFQSGHEKRGSGLTQGFADTINAPLQFHQHEIGASYDYGADSAAMGLELGLTVRDKDYTNFHQLTQSRDNTRTALESRFISRPTANIDTFLELSGQQISYDVRQQNQSSLDSKVYDALLGIRWEATAMTSGKFKLGYQKKQFETPGRENFSGLAWDLGVIWQPLSYTSFSLQTTRRSEDTDRNGDYIDMKNFSLSWNHQWRSNFSSQISLRRDDRDYAGIDRHDKQSTASFQLSYQMRRWLSFTLGADFTDKESTLDSLTFDRQAIYLGAQVSL